MIPRKSWLVPAANTCGTRDEAIMQDKARNPAAEPREEAQVPIRDAATVIALRTDGDEVRVLMGQRGDKAVFMPGKFVFPGGAVDPEDAAVPLACLPDARTLERLSVDAPEGLPHALIAAAIRELWEETGLPLAIPAAQAPATGISPPPGLSESWQGFFDAGFLPSGKGMDFVFRAVTPPGRPRRFDARFFTVDAAALAADPDDFSRASDELSHLQWIPLEKVREFDLPFITRVVLAEIAERAAGGADMGVPYFRTIDGMSWVSRL